MVHGVFHPLNFIVARLQAGRNGIGIMVKLEQKSLLSEKFKKPNLQDELVPLFLPARSRG